MIQIGLLTLGTGTNLFARQVPVRPALVTHVLMAIATDHVITASLFENATSTMRTGFGTLLQDAFRFLLLLLILQRCGGRKRTTITAVLGGLRACSRGVMARGQELHDMTASTTLHLMMGGGCCCCSCRSRTSCGSTRVRRGRRDTARLSCRGTRRTCHEMVAVRTKLLRQECGILQHG